MKSLSGGGGLGTPRRVCVVGNRPHVASIWDCLAAGLRAGQIASRPDIVPIPREEQMAAETPISESLDWLNEAEAVLAESVPAQPTPQPEAVKIGKQNISIPTGEEYSEPRLVKAVIGAESAFNPKAVSPVGAAGLMQLMPGTAKDLGLTKEERFDPDKNVEAGSRYLKQLEDQFGDKKIALAAYNWGMGNVSNAIKKLEAEGEPVTWENIKSVAKVPGETREYVDRVMLLRKYDDFDLAKIAAKVGEAKLDKVLAKYKTGRKFTVGDILDELGLDAKEVRVKRGNVLQSASNLTEETLTEKTSPSLLRTVASFAPVTGEIISAQDAINALQEGEYSNAAINALGVIPAIGLFNRIRKGAKLVDAVSDVTKAAPLTEADILYNRANKALRDIDINSLTNSLKSKQTLQNTYAELVEKTRARLARGFNKGKSKSWMDEQVAYLNENKAKLDAITTEINDTQQLLQNVIGLKQVK